MSASFALLILVALLALGISMPISLGVAALASLVLADPKFLAIMPHRIVVALNDWVLIAIVLFVLYGRLCVEMNVRARLAHTLSAILGHSRPAALVGEVVASLAQPDSGGDALLQRNDEAAATVNRLLLVGVPSWAAIGFAAVLACLRLLTPPSVFLIIAALLLELSIGSLFAALVPLVAGAAVLLFVMIVLIPPDQEAHAAGGDTAGFELGMLAWLVAPYVILGGILNGLVTAAEAGSLGVFFAVIVGLFQGQLTGRRLLRASMDTLQDAGAIVLVFAFAMTLITGFAADGSLQATRELISALGAWPALLAAIAVTVLVTALLGPLIALFVVLPIFVPPLIAAGYASMVIGVASSAAITMGLLLPPTGPLFASLIAGTTGNASRAVTGLSYFTLVIVFLLAASLLGPFWTLG